MAKIHDIYYGGEERNQEGTVRTQKSTPDGKYTWDAISTPQGFWPAGPVFANNSYKMAAENGGLKNQPYWRLIAPSNWDHASSAANGEEGIGSPYDAGLGEYFYNSPIEAGDTVRLAFIPKGYKALWAQIRIQVAAPGMVADLEWIKSDGTTEVLAADIDFGVEGFITGVKAIADGMDNNDILEKSDNYIQLNIKTPPDSQDQYRYLLDYDVSGFDYMDI
jgi:hypothetical protein